MLKIEAIVRPLERIHSVTEALEQAGCGGFHYLNVTGQGKQRGVPSDNVFTGRLLRNWSALAGSQRPS